MKRSMQPTQIALYSILLATAGGAAGCKRGEAREPPAAVAPGWTQEPPAVAGEVVVAGTLLGEVPPPRSKDEDPDLPVLVSFVGDCTLGSDYRSMTAPGSFHRAMDELHGDYGKVLAGVERVLQSDDLTVANLETTLTVTARPASGGTFVFTGKPEYARILSLGGIDLVTVANNHAADFGRRGEEETLEAVRAAGVRAFGSGRIDRTRIRGLEFVNLGYVGGATDAASVARDVRREKRPDNLVVVSFHWGTEGIHAPGDGQRKMAHAVVDAGADLVVGHHPHVLQGIEDYKGRKIVYSLGNFVFGGNGHPEDRDSMIFQQAFARGAGKAGPVANTARVVPVRLGTAEEGFRPTLLEGPEKQRVLEAVERYSKVLQ